MDAWKPISEEGIWDLINKGELKLLGSESRFFDAIRITPCKWKLEPWGTEGKGFWVMGLIGTTVLWYNDIEDCFNFSTYSNFGEIGQYHCNQDEFEYAIKCLKSYVDNGVYHAKASAPIPGVYKP